MAPAGRFDLVEKRRGWGDDPLNAWPPHFKAALAPNPLIDRMNETQFIPMLKFARDRHADGLGGPSSPAQTE
jgi:hypothetical protein